MKKIKKFVIFVLCGIFACIFFVGCSATTESKLKKNISENAKTIFTYKNSDYYITLISGQRESDYCFDGKTTSLLDFTLITLTFCSPRTQNEFILDIKIDDKQYNATLLKNPYKSNYMCDLKMAVNENTSVIITLLDQTNELECKSKDFKIDYEKAQNLAINFLKEDLTTIVNSKESKYECYLKILYKPEITDSFFWFFLVKAERQHNVVIDTMSGEILANY